MTRSESAQSITVVILTLNEEANIRHAIESVLGWAREVFIVDSFSSDRTLIIADEYRERGVRVFQHEFDNYSKQWNWAIGNLPIETPWVLKLDADELATPEFRHEVAEQLVSTNNVAFIVHWRFIFMGKWLRYGGLYPNGNVRIWKHGSARFGDRKVNEHLLVEGPVGEVLAPIDHQDRKPLSAWIERHNRYSSMEAKLIVDGNIVGEVKPRLFGRPEQRRMWLRRLYYRLPCRSVIYFTYRYIFRLGFLDGKAGFRYIFLHSAFLYWIDLKMEEENHVRSAVSSYSSRISDSQGIDQPVPTE